MVGPYSLLLFINACLHILRYDYEFLTCILRKMTLRGKKALIRSFFHTVNPLLRPPGGLFISSPFGGEGLNRDGGLNILNLETTMVSVLHKELEYKVEKLKYSKF